MKFSPRFAIALTILLVSSKMAFSTQALHPKAFCSFDQGDSIYSTAQLFIGEPESNTNLLLMRNAKPNTDFDMDPWTVTVTYSDNYPLEVAMLNGQKTTSGLGFTLNENLTLTPRVNDYYPYLNRISDLKLVVQTIVGDEEESHEIVIEGQCAQF